MFYGLFVVVPGSLVLFGVTLAWLSSSARQISKRNGARAWSLRRFLLFLYLPLITRAYVPLTAICLAWRVTNDPAEGDAPLMPFIHSLDDILIWSLLISLPYALRTFAESRKARREAELEELEESESPELSVRSFKET